jgi:hypothetical protein
MENDFPSSATQTPARRHYTPEQITGYLATQPGSGLSIAAFCQQQGLSPSVFYAWKRRRRLPGGEPPAFREMSLPLGFAPPWVAEIALPSGTLVRLSSLVDPPWIGQLLVQVNRP